MISVRLIFLRRDNQRARKGAFKPGIDTYHSVSETPFIFCRCYLVCLLLFLNLWIKISCVEGTFKGFKLHANFNQSLKQLQIICKGFFVCDFSLNCHSHKQQATCEDNLKTQCLNFVEKCLMPFSFQTKLVSPFVLLLYKVSSTTSAWFSDT